tara:strand:- start:1054 stop:1758 length:705 start_codon:yes stop_codon:yes gene_type:complete
MKKKSKKNYYFTDETQDSIYIFLNDDSLDKKERDKLYNEKIKPAFNKLVENLIFIYGINSLPEDFNVLRHDCVVFLYENLHKFDPTKGSKAFSYFNIVAKNWLILKAKQITKHNKNTVLYNDRNSTEEISKYNLQQQVTESHETSALNIEFFHLVTSELEIWKNITKNSREQIALEAIHQLFQNIDAINIYDKKAIFLYLKEITGMTTKQLCVSLNKVRSRYAKFKKKYHNNII